MVSSKLQLPFLTTHAFLLVTWHLLVPLARCAVYHSLAELPGDLKLFDFIIAGGGTAGSVVASRLSENTNFNVLLIEAGPDTAGVLEIEVPGLIGQINASIYNWNYVTTPQPGLNGRTIGVPRGRGLGGSSCINGMAYSRGASDDYDNWARLTGDPRWRWNALWPYIKRHEHWMGAAGGRNATGEYDPSVHGYSGNGDLHLVSDLNAGKPIGLTWLQLTTGGGERWSAAKSYLGQHVRRRPNLTILLNTHVTRVLSIKASKPKIDVRTVEVADRAAGSRVTFTAKKELILSGGTIGTPQILLNSGIGNRTELERLGIPVVLDSPFVGEGMMEHVTVTLTWNIVPQNTTVIDPDVAWAMWQQNRTGPLSTPGPVHQVMWYRLPQKTDVLSKYKDPSSGPGSPHFQFTFGDQGRVVLLTPYSRGSVKLNSTDPFVHPIIDQGLLTHPFDLAALKEGIRTAKKFYTGPAWEGYVLGFGGPDPDVLSTEEFETRAREVARTFLHPVGTAAMSSKHSKRGVVDSELRVKGATGLRVVDASVFPLTPASLTQGPVYIVSERAVDFIRHSWL
ncbi:hypothetical protein DFP72DRAFT_1035491 [Ephemerocybe angulata]|uniref:pyranose dehydrogenase (acceptor) n=1 Tax=Ephemerocybe angulata TaxID=980116 RepID=A0A8H6HF13_9AGAR|nr:hypothetical protein DFP72DRAFT_1035491 [Tulosesus angulatus]